MKHFLTITLLVCHHFFRSEGAGCYCVNDDKRRCYKFETEDKVPFWEAQRRCEVGGGTLAILDSAEVFDYVYNQTEPNGSYWIGLQKVNGASPTQALWINGESLNQSLYSFNFQMDDDRHECVRMLNAPTARVTDHPCGSSSNYVCQYDTSANSTESNQRHFVFGGHPDVTIDSPVSLDMANQDSTLRCSSVCVSVESCRAFSYNPVTHACRLHGYDTTSLTAFKTADSSWISFDKNERMPAHCEDVVRSQPCVTSGVFTVYPSLTLHPFPVFCWMGNDDVNWMLLMRKTNNYYFIRSLQDYNSGFGDLEGDFWLGLEKMHVLTAPWFEYELLVQFNDGSGDVNATYSNFSVRPSGPLYAISYDAFTSGAVDYLNGINGSVFFRKPSGCSMCQAAWWQGAQSCNCNPSLLMMRLVRRLHG